MHLLLDYGHLSTTFTLIFYFRSLFLGNLPLPGHLIHVDASSIMGGDLYRTLPNFTKIVAFISPDVH